jgi:integrase
VGRLPVKPVATAHWEIMADKQRPCLPPKPEGRLSAKLPYISLRAPTYDVAASGSRTRIFCPSFKLHGKQPRLGSMIVQDYIRPAAVAAGVIAEDCPRIGFHNLRHGRSTFLIGNGHDPVGVQRMLRQSHVDMTMHYVHNSPKAREAQAQFIERFLPKGWYCDR